MGQGLQFILIAAAVFAAGIWLKKAGTRLPSEKPKLPSAPASEPRSVTSRTRTFGRAQPTAPREASGYDADALAAEYQQQAERSDKRRRDKLAAHVARAVPPISEEAMAAVRQASESTLMIRHRFPPVLPQRSLSFFGGSPVTPSDGFDWPMVHNREGLLEGLTFMAQIDLSDVPTGGSRNLLPARGYLYFFAPMSLKFGSDALHFVVRYLPGPARKSWEPGTYLAAGKISNVSDDVIAMRGTDQSYPRVEMDFGWVEEPSDEEIEARRSEGFPHEVAEKMRAERADAFFGAKAEPRRRLSVEPGADAAWLLAEDFPTNRGMARTLRDRVTGHVSRQMKILDERQAAAEQLPDKEAVLRTISERRDALSSMSARNSAAFAGTDWNQKNIVPALSDEEKERARTFLSEVLTTGLVWAEGRERVAWRDKALVHSWMSQAAIKGAEEALLTPPGQDVAPIPDAIMEALASLHDARGHQMFGQGTVVQVAADEMKDRYVLLLQLGSDPTMDWLVGEMGPLQYWITPEDLAARRFENALLTMEAY